MISPTPLSPPANAQSRGEKEKEERAGLVSSQGISVEGASRPLAHRPSAVKHVYASLALLKPCPKSDGPSPGRHPPTTALYDIISVVIPLLVKSKCETSQKSNVDDTKTNRSRSTLDLNM